MGYLPSSCKSSYEEWRSYRDSDAYCIMETNLHLQLQYLISGRLEPLPEDIYPTVELIKFHWNLQCNLLERVYHSEIESPCHQEHCEKYSRRYTLLDLSRVIDRLCEILEPYVMIDLGDFSLEYGEGYYKSIRNYPYYSRYIRNIEVKVNSEGVATERAVHWRDRMSELYNSIEEFAADIIRMNNKNKSLEFLSFDIQPKEIISELLAKKVARPCQIGYTSTEEKNERNSKCLS